MGMLALAAMGLITGTSGHLETCPSRTAFSCSSSSTQPTCCFNYPGGTLLQTQFWDTNPSSGPDDSWTIHGLWPDNCDGTYQSYCDSERAYSNITAILQGQGLCDLVDYMEEYWVDINGDNENFWSHEWSKHGTCINTIDPSCYSSYKPQEEVGDFFKKTVNLFKRLDTHKALAAAGITPSTSKTYTLSAIQQALTSMHGASVYLGCSSGNLNQVWYFFHVKGNTIHGKYKAVDALTASGCPDTGIKYVPK
ncbi:Ribonuclease T2, putative [Penicillium digitatum]|uniref:ribonuclease T2 n=3 Tax=Penicillium digitatum TaxID=36651 RepID=K9GKN2_PEND2|nr:Ribonuclease T2, putative [Penicillium digitatum Pd1]EKV13781.1 Ribonuclease T2, putative [Penicillium digitatum PHI26]EKV21551.1 Ribonuclease T2, putative [Penicillium digitatum Pd1]QQK42166.1 Ribonuclease T2, putative [Penicillium digitatum]